MMEMMVYSELEECFLDFYHMGVGDVVNTIVDVIVNVYVVEV